MPIYVGGRKIREVMVGGQRMAEAWTWSSAGGWVQRYQRVPEPKWAWLEWSQESQVGTSTQIIPSWAYAVYVTAIGPGGGGAGGDGAAGKSGRGGKAGVPWSMWLSPDDWQPGNATCFFPPRALGGAKEKAGQGGQTLTINMGVTTFIRAGGDGGSGYGTATGETPSTISHPDGAGGYSLLQGTGGGQSARGELGGGGGGGYGGIFGNAGPGYSGGLGYLMLSVMNRDAIKLYYPGQLYD